MIGMRNVVVHAYFNVEPPILRETIRTDLPPLIQAIETLLDKRESP